MNAPPAPRDHDDSTLKRPSLRPSRTRTQVPCLTLCDHVDLARVGERAILRGLLVRSPVEVSRRGPLMASAGTQGRPLEDPHLSRTPLVIRGDPARELVLSCAHGEVRVDGVPLREERVIPAESLRRGVLLELQERVLLLLHPCDGGEAEQAQPDLLGVSDAMAEVRREIERAARLDVPVLVRGETGAGKEAVAHQIHRASARADGPYVAVNMATVPATTAVSMLFGHARGAFTGATHAHPGLFERAHGGTLFLDEIGEAPQEVQPMLLRVLETGQCTRMGETRERNVDVRVVAATDADLEHAAQHGGFRRALLHRLAGYELSVPPLRDRREDIALLFVHFLRQELHHEDRQLLEASPESAELPVPTEFMARLLEYPFDGNVRELRNLARRLAVASRGRSHLAVEELVERLRETGGPAAAPPAAATSGPAAASPAATTGGRSDAVDDATLIATLEANGWSPGRTADALGIPSSTLHDLMRKSPNIRRAKDIGEAELREALELSGGDISLMARRLRVSERALRMALRERSLL